MYVCVCLKQAGVECVQLGKTNTWRYSSQVGVSSVTWTLQILTRQVIQRRSELELKQTTQHRISTVSQWDETEVWSVLELVAKWTPCEHVVNTSLKDFLNISLRLGLGLDKYTAWCQNSSCHRHVTQWRRNMWGSQFWVVPPQCPPP